MKRLTIRIIEFYQRTISPDHSFMGRLRHPYGYCKFYPSCSEYARQSIEKNGTIKGLALGLWRIIRCNPLSSGGIDPVKILDFKL